MFFSSLSSSDWIAIFSGVIALIALITTLWQARLTRIHNFLSSRPVLDIDSHARADKTIGLRLRNCGPGPAFISTVTATFRKTKYALTNSREFEAFVTALVQSGIPCGNFTISVPNAETAIAPGQTFELLTAEEKDNREIISAKYRERMHEVSLEVLYKSLYSQEYRASYDSPVVNCV